MLSWLLCAGLLILQGMSNVLHDAMCTTCGDASTRAQRMRAKHCLADQVVNSACLQAYGGCKESGLGREGVHFAMADYLEIRTMLMSNPGGSL